MSLVPAKCPECGGNINIDGSKKAAICEFCKQPFVVQDAINNFNTTYNITNKNEIKADVVNVYESKNSDFVIEAGVLRKYQGESQDVIIPENVIHIDQDTFAGLRIRKVSLPMHTTLDRDVFARIMGKTDLNATTKQLQSLSLESSMHLTENVRLQIMNFEGNWKLFDKTTLVEYLGDDEIVEIPERILKLKSGAFRGKTKLKKIIITNPNLEMDFYTFWDCPQLEEVEAPVQLLSNLDIMMNLKGTGYMNCPSIRKLTLYNNLSSYKLPDFGKIAWLEELKFTKDSNVTQGSIDAEIVIEGNYHGSPLSECESLRKVVVESSLKIGDFGFANCTNLQEVILPNDMEKLGTYAFERCTNLKKVNIPLGLRDIPNNAFAYCEALEEIVIPNNIRTISADFEVWGSINGAFAGCTSLKKVILEKGVERIGHLAFSGCVALEEIEIKNAAITIDRDPFLGCKNLKRIICSRPLNLEIERNGMGRDFGLKGTPYYMKYCKDRRICPECGQRLSLLGVCKSSVRCSNF